MPLNSGKNWKNKHTDLNMAHVVWLDAMVIGIVRPTDLIVSTLCILDRSAEDTSFTHQPEYVAELCPCVDLVAQHVGLCAPLHLGVR